MLEKNGMRKIRFHDLRHTYSVIALQNGVDAKTLQKDLGHHSAVFMLDVYGHVTPYMERQKAKKIGDFLSSQMNKIQPEEETQ
jgi:integrase